MSSSDPDNSSHQEGSGNKDAYEDAANAADAADAADDVAKDGIEQAVKDTDAKDVDADILASHIHSMSSKTLSEVAFTAPIQTCK